LTEPGDVPWERDTTVETATEYGHLLPLFHEMAALADDDPRRLELRSQLVIGYLPLAQQVARRFWNRGEPYGDLEQTATLGLINAVDRFDADRGTDFPAFAIPTILGAVRRHFRDTSWSLQVPRRFKELHLRIGSAIADLAQQLGRAPAPTDIAAHLNVPVEDVYQGIEAMAAYRTSSLDGMAVDGAQSTALIAAIGFEDEALANVEYHESLRPLLRQLPERELRILTMRFYLNMTQSQIAERLGISQMHVSRLLARTLAGLRDKLLG
jgi:RNA polymerase sigma-B factor